MTGHGGMALDLSHPQVMGILNVTPDSFSDGGRFFNRSAALRRADEMIAEGAALLDVGGESTRPDATPVSTQEELDRVIPVVEALRDAPVLVSVDTSKPDVMAEALRAGAGMINDVRALRLPGALEVLAGSRAAVCLMHMQGEPATMQKNPHYHDVVADIKTFLAERVRSCEAVGIARGRLFLDPGFGFGKTLEHNLTLLKRLGEFRELGLPLLVGLSRKSMIGRILDAPPEERLPGSLAAAVIAAWQGATIFRVHDVLPTVRALSICARVLEAAP